MTIDGNLVVGIQVGGVVGFAVGIGVALAAMAAVKRITGPGAEVEEPSTGTTGLWAARDKQRARRIKVHGPHQTRTDVERTILRGLKDAEDVAASKIEDSKERIDGLVRSALDRARPSLLAQGHRLDDAEAVLRDAIGRALAGAFLSDDGKGICEPADEEMAPWIVTVGLDEGRVDAAIGVSLFVGGISIEIVQGIKAESEKATGAQA